MAVCKLCKIDKDLIDSHIIPHFVIEWLRKTSPTGYMRDVINPNKRIQDSVKLKLLCRDCEVLLSKDEKKFSEIIFRPYVDTELSEKGSATGVIKEFKYDQWLLRFIISVHWRILVKEREDLSKSLSSYQLKVIDLKLEVWRKFILFELDSTGPQKSYLIFLQSFREGKGNLILKLNERIDIYILRSIDGTSVFTSKTLGVFAKFGPVVAYTTILPDELKGISDAKLKKNGAIKTAQSLSNDDLLRFILIDRPNETLALTKVSKKQNDVIDRDLRKNPEKVFKSLAFASEETRRRIKHLKSIDSGHDA
ncbi:hypothetical protein EHQ27_05405 [Leptospira wolffii]|uniref:hypothetical protein n=1 Tax=Leptospira wolffii TaxID=409998 RepID=UPI001083BF85|nr:hypothetical protein [Leptospira wolffii]TGK71456.1 hypothetical protein EHQ35_15135 [Leptospira wolffii]TGK75366.1 hypothetical protein EHQ27_05405 [Leptospira wolffii]TGL29267.1 hypothetical protein EHQ57_10020 [Leptospira wolffii]